MLLVGGLEQELYFPSPIWDVILPIDELIFFKMNSWNRGGGAGGGGSELII